ncbi:MAG: DUF427 domain-containing protein [Nitriliruptor sp.]|nr:MAG: DUF427 domain-containing protein [Nitriliruptor sp.]
MRSRPTPEPVGPGQESVWSYPRPPALDPTDEHVVVEFAGRNVADTRRAIRVLETSHPPSYYLPLEDVDQGLLVPNPHRTFCEFKGQAAYVDLVVGERRSELAGWYYPRPTPAFAALVDHVTFYPGRVDRCLVDDEVVRASDSGFYGGWITSRVVGPFKGAPGTQWW